MPDDLMARNDGHAFADGRRQRDARRARASLAVGTEQGDDFGLGVLIGAVLLQEAHARMFRQVDGVVEQHADGGLQHAHGATSSP
ncbi:MAG: hypothetical protein ACK55I_09620, partial [bacterium]